MTSFLLCVLLCRSFRLDCSLHTLIPILEKANASIISAHFSLPDLTYIVQLIPQSKFPLATTTTALMAAVENPSSTTPQGTSAVENDIISPSSAPTMSADVEEDTSARRVTRGSGSAGAKPAPQVSQSPARTIILKGKEIGKAAKPASGDEGTTVKLAGQNQSNSAESQTVPAIEEASTASNSAIAKEPQSTQPTLAAGKNQVATDKEQDAGEKNNDSGSVTPQGSVPLP